MQLHSFPYPSIFDQSLTGRIKSLKREYDTHVNIELFFFFAGGSSSSASRAEDDEEESEEETSETTPSVVPPNTLSMCH